MDRHEWDARYRQKELLWTAEPNRFLVEAVAGLEPGSAYDLAGGEGRNAVWLAERGWHVTVFDWSAVALEKGRALAEHRGVVVDFVEQDLLDWKARERVGLVVVAYLHLPERERRAVWHEAADAVAPGGTLVVIGHDSSNIAEGYGGPQHPAVLYTADEVTAALEGLLTVTRAERVERPVETGGGMRVALDNVVVGVAES